MKAVLRDRSGLDGGRKIQLDEFPFIIGRGDHCHLHLPSELVSRSHCQLDRAGPQLFVGDLESTNGTFVNDVRISGRHVLLAHDVLKVGMTAFCVDLEEDLGDDTVAMNQYVGHRPAVREYSMG